MNDVAADPIDTTAEPIEAPASRGRDRADVINGSAEPTWLALCPYLRDVSGEWRAITPTTDHRCTAVVPPGPVTAETQRTLCLVQAHVDCPVYQNAREARHEALGAAGAAGPRRPIPLTAPVILEQPTGLALLAARLGESLPQLGLLVLIALAVAAVVLARVIAP